MLPFCALRMAREYKLDLLYRKPFHDVFVENQEDPELKALLFRMKVVDKDGKRTMDDAQWEATSTSLLFFVLFQPFTNFGQIFLDIYIAFAFQKRQ